MQKQVRKMLAQSRIIFVLVIIKNYNRIKSISDKILNISPGINVTFKTPEEVPNLNLAFYDLTLTQTKRGKLALLKK